MSKFMEGIIEVEKHLDWSQPVISCEDGCFDLEIKKNEIEITCSWDNGFGGSGSETIFVNIDELLKLVDELKNAIK